MITPGMRAFAIGVTEVAGGGGHILPGLNGIATRPRKEAWFRLADRLGIEESRSFATMLRQAEEMGTSLGDTLTAFSDDMRAKRMLRTEEKALALPAKLVIPLILFIFPCLMGGALDARHLPGEPSLAEELTR